MLDVLRKDRIIAPPGFNRWRVPPASIAIHLCIGSVYAWSIFNPPLLRLHGIATSSADDWTLEQVVWVFSVAIATLGITAAVAGRWLERVGPRAVGVAAACCYGGGFLLAGVAIDHRQLWLLYLGYGVLAGAGLGLGYVSPVSTLIRWFPDRRGMATGMAIMGFGGGAMIAAPLEQALIEHFYRAPQWLGNVDAVALVTEGGRRLADVGGTLREVVVVGANEVGAMTLPGEPGVYLVGTGNAGVAETFFVLGALYFAVMVAAAFAYRVPADDWTPPGRAKPTPAGDDPRRALVNHAHVGIDEAMRTRQFWQLWLLLCLNVTAGIGVLGVAKTMLTEIFGRAMPAVVDGGFAATYVLMISVSNMVGRFGWSTLSDLIGRRRIYTVFFAVGAALYLSIPALAHRGAQAGSVPWLVAFYVVTLLVFTMYGGGFAAFPAYLADIFGSRFVGAIHGRALTAWSLAGVLGPVLITRLRARAEASAIRELAAQVDPASFVDAFGGGMADLDALITAKTVTIAKLLSLAPPGTPDPSSGLYDSTMLLMAALLVVGLIVNQRVRPPSTGS